jgi:conjugative transfer pilus assembly protein TraH
LGGFSFINKDQIIQMARQIGSTAISTSFYLALDSMSPELSQVMKTMQEWANRANQFSINSCEAGTRLGASVWRNMGGDKSDFCKRVKTGSGVVSDEYTARIACDTDGWDFSWVPGASSSATDETKIKRLVAGNVVWRALKSAGINDRELGELIMSVTGTVIVPQGNSNNPPKAQPVPSTIGYQEFMEGTKAFQILSCDEANECMRPSVVTYTNDNRVASIRERIRKAIDHIVNAASPASGIDIANCTTCVNSGDALMVISLSEYPIFALIQAEYDAGMSGGSVARDNQELLIREITYRFFSKAATPLSAALANDGEAVAGTESQREQIAAHLRQQLQLASDNLNQEATRRGGISQMMAVYMQMKQMASSRYAPALTDRLKFAQILRR